MPLPVRLAVLVSATLFAVTSTAINLSFLTSLGRSRIETTVFGGVSLAADVARLVLPVVIGAALRAKRYVAAGAALLMLGLVVALSLASGAGFAATTRGNVLAERTETAARIQDLQKRLQDLDRRLLVLAGAGEVGPIKAALEGRNRDPRWAASALCVTPRGPAERRWCQSVLPLDVQVAAAQAREALEAERRAAAAALSAARTALGGDHPDPQAAALSSLLALSPELVRAGFSLGIALVLELGSAILVYLAASPPDLPKQRPPADDDASESATRAEPMPPEIPSRPPSCRRKSTVRIGRSAGSRTGQPQHQPRSRAMNVDEDEEEERRRQQQERKRLSARTGCMAEPPGARRMLPRSAQRTADGPYPSHAAARASTGEGAPDCHQEARRRAEHAGAAGTYGRCVSGGARRHRRGTATDG